MKDEGSIMLMRQKWKINIQAGGEILQDLNSVTIKIQANHIRLIISSNSRDFHLMSGIPCTAGLYISDYYCVQGQWRADTG